MGGGGGPGSRHDLHPEHDVRARLEGVLRPEQAAPGGPFTARRLCHHAVAVSRHAKRSAVRLLGFREDRVTVIHNTVDTARFAGPDPALRRAVRAELGAAPDEFVLASAARFVPQKGFAVMVRAMEKLLPAVPRARLYLAGGREEEEESLRGLSRSLSLGGRVVFLGVRDDTHRVFQAADAFLFASLASEGFPLVPLEAMALGVRWRRAASSPWASSSRTA